jgi:hypothetical protein
MKLCHLKRWHQCCGSWSTSLCTTGETHDHASCHPGCLLYLSGSQYSAMLLTSGACLLYPAMQGTARGDDHRPQDRARDLRALPAGHDAGAAAGKMLAALLPL